MSEDTEVEVISASALAVAFEAAPVALLIFDTSLTMVHANAAFLDMVSMTPDAVLGRNIFEVFVDDPSATGPSQVAALRSLMVQAVESGEPQTMHDYPFSIPAAGGVFVERVYEMREVPIVGSDGQVSMVVHFADDITDRVHARRDRDLLDEVAAKLQIELRREHAELGQAHEQLRGRATGLESANRELAATSVHDRSISATLQHALLDQVYIPDHLNIKVAYESAANRVGGDWYDVFRCGEKTAIVVGDVVGHDVQAAADMGRIRNMLRTIVWLNAAGPAEALRCLDSALCDLKVEVMATVFLALVDQPRADGRVELVWSNAGHPAPVLADSDGSVGFLKAAETDLFVGVDVNVVRREHSVLLEPGSSLLVYTDGLTERRGEHPDRGYERLLEAVKAHRSRTQSGRASEIGVRELIEQLIIGEPEDDVAVVAVAF